MKKKCPLLFAAILFSILISSSVLATAEDDVNRVGTTVQVAEEDDRLARITSIPDVQEIIQEVKAARLASQSTPEEQVMSEEDWEDVWKKIENSGELKEQVFTILNGKSTSPTGTVTENETNYNYDLGNFDKKQTDALKKLQEYLKERLNKKLFGENPAETSGVKAVKDHNVFHKLYSSQIGKNLMVELAKYCLHSDPETGIVPYKSGDNKKAHFYRRINTETVNTYAEKRNETGLRPFDSCVTNIGRSCDEPNYPSVHRQDGSSIPRFQAFNQLTTQEKDQYSSTDPGIPKPCEISRYMTEVKITLKQLEEYEEENQISSARASNSFQVELKQKEDLDIDSVVNISSGELLDGDGNGFREEAQAEALRAQECITQGSQACDDYTVKSDESLEIEDEFNLRNFAMQKKLEDEVLSDQAEPEQLKEFLIGKGMTEENIDRLIAMKTEDGTTTEIEAYTQIIKDRFKNEREALKESLSNRLKERAEADPTDTAAVEAQAEKVRQSIEASPMQLAQVFQYANVVSSFLSVNRSDGTSSTNTAALAAELDDPFVDPSNSTGPPQDLSALSQYALEQPQKDSEQGNAVLGSSEIDKIQFSITSEESP